MAHAKTKTKQSKKKQTDQSKDHAEIEVPDHKDRSKSKKIMINLAEYETLRPHLITLLQEGIFYYNEISTQLMKRWKYKIGRQRVSRYIQYMHRERQNVQQVDGVIEQVIQTQVKVVIEMAKAFRKAAKNPDTVPNALADMGVKLMSATKTYQQTLQNYGIMPAEIAKIEHDVSERSFASIIKAAEGAVRIRELEMAKEKSDKDTQ